MRGKIVKGIAGFYYVHVPGHGVYECRAKGIFRSQGRKPLVGDDVQVEVLDEAALKGNMSEIFKRRNELVRPAVSNVDQAMVIFAAAKPAPNLNLLDRFLIMMAMQGVETIICFNKMDEVAAAERSALEQTYLRCGYQVIFTSALLERGIDQILELLHDKTTVLAGPSGVGKSSLLNLIRPGTNMETGEISRKIERGRHTTRHSELFCVEDSTYIMDTPGFSSLMIADLEKGQLKDYFHEFSEYEGNCRFLGCAHIHEPGCAVREALEQNQISRLRYQNYVFLYEELKNQKKY